jgi:hypothetical protein
VVPQEVCGIKKAELALEAILKIPCHIANQWSMGLGGFGEMLPYYENRVYIDHSKRQMGTTCFRN